VRNNERHRSHTAKRALRREPHKQSEQERPGHAAQRPTPRAYSSAAFSAHAHTASVRLTTRAVVVA